MTDSNAPRIGLIVPPATGEVPFEGPALYGSRIAFHARGLGLGSVTPAGYDEVIESVVGHARALAEQDMRAISLMGTSLSFYRGAGFTRELRERTGRPFALNLWLPFQAPGERPPADGFDREEFDRFMRDRQSRTPTTGNENGSTSDNGNGPSSSL